LDKEDTIKGVYSMSNIEEVLEERETTYGGFTMNAIVSQGMKSHLKLGSSWNSMPVAHKEALEMICHKMSRIVNGNSEYKDSWTDIIGYASLVEKELK
jgi:hypothetical protein